MELFETHADFTHRGKPKVIQIALHDPGLVIRTRLRKPINVDLHLLLVHLVEVFTDCGGKLGSRHRDLVREKKEDVVDDRILDCEGSSRIKERPEGVREIVRPRHL